jgi:hypothetical protein
MTGGSTKRYTSLFQEAENLLCVTENKVQRNLLEGFAQNIKNSKVRTKRTRKKRKRVDDDDFDYLYGIVTTARDWHFLLYSISQAKLPVAIEFIIMC